MTSATQIQCDCGKFKAEILKFPQETLGRAVCYCIDCQTYLHYLGRPELLDPAGGTEIIPVYPNNFKIVAGAENLKCTRLSPKGLYRWSTKCCHSPIGNIASVPWIGLIHSVFKKNGSHFLDEKLGPIKCRIMGKYAEGTPPLGTSDSTSLKDMWTITPFILKGVLLKKNSENPFFKDSNPIAKPQVLSKEERKRFTPVHASQVLAGN